MPTRTAMLETLLCLLAVLGLGASLVPDYRHVATIDYVATDFKTLYASANLLVRHHDPYKIDALPAIFHSQSVVEPATWFSRSPVYPPATLAIIVPFTRLSMAHAAIVWFALSLAAYAGALALVLASARRQGLGWPWRLAILALATANPMLAYALEVGNVSVLVSAAAIAAWMLLLARPAVTHWLWPTLLLAVALLLKPHLAFWIVLGLVLFAGAVARKAGLAAILFAAAFTASTSLWLTANGLFLSTARSYGALLIAERLGGSMAAGSRELLPLPAQITALQSILSLFCSPHLRDALTIALLLALAGLLFVSIGSIGHPNASNLAIAAVAAFGLIATYHRAHDSLILLPLLLWIASALAGSMGAGKRVSAAAVLFLWLILWSPLPGRIFALRQQAMVLFCLTLLLAIFTRNQAKKGGMNGILSMPGGQ